MKQERTNRVLVMGKDRMPLMPCHPARARQLLKAGRAAVLRRYPFTIILRGRTGGYRQPVQCKIDPGSKTTGLSVIASYEKRGTTVVWAADLQHRGSQIKKRLQDRRAHRRSRRARHTRYRQARFLNRRKPKGWLPPSLQHRVLTTMTWVERLRRFCPVTGLSMELVKFDTQAMDNPEISGAEYQQGELLGYEVREYLLEKWQRTCAYCGETDVPLQVEHIVPKSRGGSDRVSNLTLACADCNRRKNNQTAAEFGHPEIQSRAKQPLKDAAAVNATRWALYGQLQTTGLSVEIGTGGRTKYNRNKQGYPKAHWIDAACVGASGAAVGLDPEMRILSIRATGHGNRQMCATDKYGFPKQHRGREKQYLGFQTGDLVKAIVPTGKAAGVHVGRVTIRRRPSFRLNGFDIHPKYMRIMQHADGYEYQEAKEAAHSSQG